MTTVFAMVFFPYDSKFIVVLSISPQPLSYLSMVT